VNELLDDKKKETEKAVGRVADSQELIFELKDPFYEEVVNGAQAVKDQLAGDSSEEPNARVCDLLQSLGVTDPYVSCPSRLTMHTPVVQ
jgi:hypothetical protein